MYWHLNASLDGSGSRSACNPSEALEMDDGGRWYVYNPARLDIFDLRLGIIQVYPFNARILPAYDI